MRTTHPGASWRRRSTSIGRSASTAPDDPVVYAKLKELTSSRSRVGPSARTYFPPPESEGGWRKLDDADSIRRLAGMEPEN